MAVYTELKKTLIDELADDYNLGRITDVIPIPDGSVNSNYLIEAGKARLLLRIDEVKSEGEVKREIEESIEFAEQSAEPTAEALYQDVTVAPFIPQE